MIDTILVLSFSVFLTCFQSVCFLRAVSLLDGSGGECSVPVRAWPVADARIVGDGSDWTGVSHCSLGRDSPTGSFTGLVHEPYGEPSQFVSLRFLSLGTIDYFGPNNSLL